MAHGSIQRNIPFTGNPGLQVQTVGFEPYDYFALVINDDLLKVSATLKIAIFPYFRFQRFQIDMLESFLLKKKLEENIISVQRYRG